MEGAALAKISDTEKFIFKINREKSEKSIIDRIAFQNEIDSDEVEEKLAIVLHDVKPRLSSTEDTAMQKKTKNQSPNLSLKRKSIERNDKDVSFQVDSDSSNSKHAEDVVNLLSDSDTELPGRKNEEVAAKRVKLEPIVEEKLETCIKQELIKTEIDDDEYESGIVKQELFGYDDEPINLDTDSDSDTERRWFIRLSQSSPGKPLTKAMKRDVVDGPARESSYSQIIEDDYEPALPSNENDALEDEEFMDDLIRIPVRSTEDEEGVDQVDGYSNTGLTSDYFAQQLEKEADKEPPAEVPTAEVPAESSSVKKTQMIEALAQTSRRKSTVESKPKEKSSSSKHSKSSSKHSHSHSKRHMSSSQKEERKKKLKEIASKEKEVRDKNNTSSSSSSKATVGAKVSTSSRGAFLAEDTATVQPTSRKDSPKSSKTHHKDSDKKHSKRKTEDAVNNIENRNKHDDKPHSSSSKSKSKSEKKDKHRKSSKSDVESTSEQKVVKKSETRVPLKNLKPLTDSDDTHSGRPVSKVEPFPTKKAKKTVRFSDAPPQVKVFEIEPGNQMKKTSLVKSTIDVPQKPVFSLEKITLIRILRWNPQWLTEQVNNNEPPPILGHSVPPMAVLHFFQAHTQYCQVIGDLLLMEIWESVTQTFNKQRGAEFTLRIEALPPPPSPDAAFDTYSLSVNVSVPKNEMKNLPRMGELMLVTFGPEGSKTSRFFYVNHVRCLPSPPS
ncbi:hypothetical protein JYU34_021080 [Plutella xylostella]|uniref:Uncharacterized protein n=1 Tax=Plutella xylostella TaxID=51655 RepID=A0ABQ7PSN0_PLUXY|nr:hypothetical protein JYU34_021080 [Plutella xylostella]